MARSLLLMAVLVPVSGLLLLAQDLPLTGEDLSAGVVNARTKISDYRLRYNVSWSFIRRVVWDESEAPSPFARAPMKLIRLRPATQEELKKVMAYSCSYLSKGRLFAYDMRLDDQTSDSVMQQKCAYDGTQYRVMEDRQGSPYPVGSIERTSRPEAKSYSSLLRPEDFFEVLEQRPLTEWLGDQSAEVKGVEEVDGKTCYVIDSNWREGKETARVWICPEMSFRPLRIEWADRDEIKHVYKIEQMKEAAPGWWFPLSAILQIYAKDPETGEIVLQSEVKFAAEVETLAVNTGLTDDLFTFTFPNGTQVRDENVGLLVTVGGQMPAGEVVDPLVEAAGEAQEAGEAHVDTGPSAKAVADSSSTGSPSVGRSNVGGSKLRVLCFGALGLAIIVLAFVAVRYARRSRPR